MTSVTIAIPAYNEEQHIARCVASALDQAQDSTVDVLVCDDASTDATPHILHDLARGTGLRVIQNGENRGLLATTQRLVDEADGDIVLKVDADCVLEAGLVDAVRDAIADGAAIAYGRVRVANTEFLHPAACAIGHGWGTGATHGGACIAIDTHQVSLDGLQQNVERELRYRVEHDGLGVARLDVGVASDFPVRVREWLPRKYQSGAVYLRASEPTPSAFRLRELRGPAFWTATVLLVAWAALTGATWWLALPLVVIVSRYWHEAQDAASLSGRYSVGVLLIPYRVVSGLARTAGVWMALPTLGRVLRGKVTGGEAA